MTDGLPEGWVEASLKVVAKVEWGNTSITKKSYVDNGVPAFSASGQDGFVRDADWHGDAVVLSAIGARCGRCFLASGDWTAIKNTIVIQPRGPAIEARYLFHFLNDEKRWPIAGSGQPFITMGGANEVEVPLAPLPEQRRIVEKVEALLEQVKQAKARLDRVPLILKRFRQSVLAAACSGELTREWREANPDRGSPPSVSRIVTEDTPRKGRLWGGGEVPELSDDERSAIPASWTWMKVAELGTSPDEAVQIGPMSMKSSEFTAGGVTVLNVGCVQPGRIDRGKCDFLPPAKAAEFARYRVRVDDVLFTRSGTVGRCAVARREDEGAVMTFHLLRVRPDQSRCSSEYLWAAFQGAPSIRRQTGEGQIGSTRGGFNTRLLASLDVPVPPRAEQDEVVRSVRRLFALADAADDRLQSATAQAGRLPQAILSKAFSGQLVPTEAELALAEGRTYETAEELLSRVVTVGNEPAAKDKPARRQRRRSA